MSVKQLYLDIKSKIETDVTEIKHVRIFNNQFERDNIESAFDYPVVFIEFSSMIYENKSQGLQDGAIQLTLHCGFKSFKDEDVDFFTITQKIFSALNGYGKEYFDPLRRIEEIQDTDHDDVFIWEMIFETPRLIDCDDYVHKDKQTTYATKISFEKDLLINNVNIRTGIMNVLNIANKFAWFDATDPLLMKNASGKAENIVDRVRGITMEQTTVSKQPAIMTDSNGLSYLRFDGSEGMETVNTIDLTTKNVMNVFVVVKATPEANKIVIESSTNSFNNSESFAVLFDGDANFRGSLRGEIGFSTSDMDDTPVDELHAFSIEFDKAKETDEVLLIVDNSKVDQTRDFNSDNSNNFGQYTWYLGARGTTSRFIKMDFYEIIMFDRRITVNERIVIQDYFAKKYGI